MASNSTAFDFVLPDNASPYLRALIEFMEAWNTFDCDRIMGRLDSSFEHHVLPKSYGHASSNFEQYEAFTKKTISSFKGLTITMHEVFEDKEKIAVYATSIGETSTGATYNNEYTFYAYFMPPRPQSPVSTELPKLRLLKEFIDSAYTIKFFAEEAARVEVANNLK